MNDKNNREKKELPLGFGMKLAMNERAMHNFEMLNEQEKKKIVEESRQATSRKDMDKIINRIADSESFKQSSNKTF